MLRVTDFKFTAEQITGSADAIALAVNINDGYEYVDGKRTDKLTHKKVEAVLPQNKYEKVIVKVADLKIPLTPEMLAQKGSIKVKFKNLTGKFYRTSSGEYALTCSADGLEVTT